MARPGAPNEPKAVSIAAEPADSEDGRRCLQSFYDELALRFDTGFDPAKSRTVDVTALTPPHGALAIARLDGRPVGCCALRAKDGGIGEIKHLWVDPAARGLGIGRGLLDYLENLAREFGHHTLQLDTNRALHEAQALYHACGYHEVPAFNDEPYAHHWFEKRIG